MEYHRQRHQFVNSQAQHLNMAEQDVVFRNHLNSNHHPHIHDYYDEMNYYYYDLEELGQVKLEPIQQPSSSSSPLQQHFGGQQPEFYHHHHHQYNAFHLSAPQLLDQHHAAPEYPCEDLVFIPRQEEVYCPGLVYGGPFDDPYYFYNEGDEANHEQPCVEVSRGERESEIISHLENLVIDVVNDFCKVGRSRGGDGEHDNNNNNKGDLMEPSATLTRYEEGPKFVFPDRRSSSNIEEDDDDDDDNDNNNTNENDGGEEIADAVDEKPKAKAEELEEGKDFTSAPSTNIIRADIKHEEDSRPHEEQPALSSSSNNNNNDNDDNNNNKNNSAAAATVAVPLAKKPKDSVVRMKANPNKVHKVCFAYPKSTRKFACTLRIIGMIIELLKSGKRATKRDLFYNDVELFQTQAVVDEIIDDLACLLNVPRFYLNVVASCKGVIGGCLSFQENDDLIDCTKFGVAGRAITPLIDQICDLELLYGAQFVLVVEKDAVFTRLMEDGFWKKYPCVIITGKGFPCVATRMMLKKISLSFPQLPIYALTDADPFGLEILSVYTNGSKALSYNADDLAVPSISWIGLCLSDLYEISKEAKWLTTTTTTTGITSSNDINNSNDNNNCNKCLVADCFLPLSNRDKKKAHSMLKRPPRYFPKKWRDELMLMLQYEQKAEIQALSIFSLDFLSENYLPRKLGFLNAPTY